MRRMSRAALVAVLAVQGLFGASPAGSHPLPAAPACPIFPTNNPWNDRVDRLPVARNSATLIASIGLDSHMHAAFGSGWYEGRRLGIPITVVSNRVRKVRVHFSHAYAAHSDRRRYPLVPWTGIEGTSDRHAVVVDRGTCTDYELYGLRRAANGSWWADAGAIFNLRSNRLRPAGWLSADAAGLPILPGLARYSDVARGSIDHALRFFAPYTRGSFVYPARHYGEDYYNRSLPPMGVRVRLKARVNISHLPYQARVIAIALKRYGMILADNGPAWFIAGAPDSHWNNLVLHTLGRLTGRDFEVVNTSSLPRPGASR